jgi:hypothetical protein
MCSFKIDAYQAVTESRKKRKRPLTASGSNGTRNARNEGKVN